MAKYACPYCPYFVHTSGGIPNHNEWLIVSAQEHDAMPELIPSDALYRASKFLYKCVSCAAIAIFWRGFEADPTWYLPNKIN
jgi:DNA-directed RNA polymerase subunit RPC12/RpoP